MIKRITIVRILGLLALLLAGSVGSALADDFGVSMQFDGVLNPSATWAGPEDVYVSPYTATDLSTNLASDITIYCLDWNHDIGFGQTWTADFISLNPSSSDLSDLYYYNSTNAYELQNTGTLNPVTLDQTQMYDRYLKAAWLFSQIQALGTLNSTNATTQAELNVAAWTLFLDASPVSGGNPGGSTSTSAFATDIKNTSPSPTFAQDVYADLQNAQTAVLGGYAAPGWYAVTPYNKTPGSGDVTQEFLAYDPTETSNQDPVVPEPQAIILFGTLIGILGASRYRRQKRA